MADWLDDHFPGRRATRKYTQHDPLLYPRFPDTDVPVPAEDTPCVHEPDIWFPTPKVPSTAEAKRVCGYCWMVPECRAYGLAHPNLDGVWGGMSKLERQKYK